MSSLVKIVLVYCLLEICIKLIIDSLSTQFQWIITKKSEIPFLEKAVLQKYAETSHHAILGWVRPANSSGSERVGHRRTNFKIDTTGSRSICDSYDKITVSTFGDSFTFCRQVNDNETWQSYLGKTMKTGIKNFGVGNYGIDQALLRYELIEDFDQTEMVIICVVPETISRIQSVWKHYFEHGNTLAFKPRFELIGEELKLIPNFLVDTSMYKSLSDRGIRQSLQSSDYFYKKKFKKYQYRFPYSVHLFRHPIRQIRLLVLVLIHICSSVEVDPRERFSSAWKQIIKENIKISQRLYGDERSSNLLTKLLNRFNRTALDNGHDLLVVVIPQLADLHSRPKQRIKYQRFFEARSKEMNVLDLTNEFILNQAKQLYNEETNGGHLTPEGNEFVAALIYQKIQRIEALKG